MLRRSLFNWLAVSATIVALAQASVSADVAIIANRARAMVHFSVAVEGGAKREYRLDPGDLVPITLRAGHQTTLEFDAAGKRKSYLLEANSPYFFHSDAKSQQLDLDRIGLSDERTITDAGAAAPAAVPPPAPIEDPKTTEPTTVRVKILVDEEEPAIRRIWEERLKKRVAAASEIFERYARIKLEVVATDTWKSENWTDGDASVNFTKSLREFETKVSPQPAQIAIGFTSQYANLLPKGRTHLGGTRGPLMSHILLREWSKHVSEPERLELLVHELGHHFGASHSPELDSVMRPVLGDRKAVARNFRITFDPLNALAMNLVGEEIRDRGITTFGGFRPTVRRRLVEVYATLGRLMPEDPAAGHYLAMLGETPVVPLAPTKKTGSTLIDGTRQVIAAVVEAAARNRGLSRASGVAAAAQPSRPAGELLTEQYVRAAAAAAATLPADDRVKSLCLGLAVALGDTDSLSGNPLTKELLPLLETDQQRKVRLALIGTPTMHSRNDLVRHFFVSAGLASLAGPEIAESIGLLKEFKDAGGGSGFSFADLCADLAGVAFVKHLQSAAGFEAVVKSFSVTAYLPPVNKLPEGLQMPQFQTSYGSPSDPRFRAEMDKLRERVRTLEAYKSGDAAAAVRTTSSTPVKSGGMP